MPIQQLRIQSLTANNSQIFETESVLDDDRGGIAATRGAFFVTGDDATAAIARNGVVANTTVRLDGIFGDAGTGDLFTLATSSTTPLDQDGGGGNMIITHILPLDETTGAIDGAAIELTDTNGNPFSIDIADGTYQRDAVFAGAGRVVVYTNDPSGHLYDINTDTGVVTDLGAFARPDMRTSENWAAWGVAEFFEGELYLTYRSASSETIERLSVSTGQTETLATFTDLGDVAGIAVSPADGRWYFRYEGSSEFGNGDELAGFADATIQLGAVTSPSAPALPVSFPGGEGSDFLSGNDVGNIIFARGGSDTVLGGLGNDTISGNQGNDILNGNQGNDIMNGGRGDDQVYGGMGNDTLFGDRGNDVVFGGMGDDNINGGQGNDLVNGNQGNDIVRGGQGDDEVRGGAGDDVVFGDLGNDQIWGDLGNDTLSGGGGADTFRFAASSGNDVIVDFNQAEGDRLDFQGQAFTVSEVNGSTVFDLSGGGTIVLQGVSPASLGDFLIA